MPLLTLRYKDKVPQEYPIQIGQTLTIGRKSANDIVIDNLSVSGVHARVDSVSATFIITDLESTNGTFVNEELISAHGLRHGDVILIGKHTLTFDRSDIDQKATGSDELNEADATRHLETAEYRELINKTRGESKTSQRQMPATESRTRKGGFFSRLLEKIFG